MSSSVSEVLPPRATAWMDQLGELLSAGSPYVAHPTAEVVRAHAELERVVVTVYETYRQAVECSAEERERVRLLQEREVINVRSRAAYQQMLERHEDEMRKHQKSFDDALGVNTSHLASLAHGAQLPSPRVSARALDAPSDAAPIATQAPGASTAAGAMTPGATTALARATAAGARPSPSESAVPPSPKKRRVKRASEEIVEKK